MRPTETCNITGGGIKEIRLLRVALHVLRGNETFEASGAPNLMAKRQLRSDKLRKCSGCGKTKRLSQFNKDKSRPGGYSYTCKLCQAVQARKYYSENREASKLTRKRWRQGRPVPRKLAEAEKYYREIAFHQNRRARLQGVPGTFTGLEFQRLCEAFNMQCARCGKLATEEKLMTADHVVPISVGGANVIANLQPLCLSCNSKKGDKIADYRTKTEDFVDPLGPIEPVN